MAEEVSDASIDKQRLGEESALCTGRPPGLRFDVLYGWAPLLPEMVTATFDTEAVIDCESYRVLTVTAVTIAEKRAHTCP